MSKRVLVVGAGGMAEAYHKVLSAMGAEFDIVAVANIPRIFSFKKPVFSLPQEGYSLFEAAVPEYAIIATGVEHL